MEKAGDVVDFKVGQLAEMRTFENGFRSAWFRCKVLDIKLKENRIFLDYNIDYESEEPSWVEIYQMPPYGRKSKHIKELLMVRPPYPVIHRKDNMPPITSISEACVVIDGPWKVGNLVDWFKDDCFWSATIIKLLSDDMVLIELPMFPVGQRKKSEEGKHEALCKDLRPSLNWSETKGWTFLVEEGHTPCDAHLVYPTKQGTDVEVEQAVSVNASSATLIPAEGDSEKNEDVEVEHAAADGDSEKNEDVAVEHAVAVVNASSTTDIPAAEGDKDSEQNENVKLDCGLVESSESVSSLRVEKRKAPEPEAADEEVEAAAGEVEKQELNIMREHTLEAAILDLEGLVNKVKWMQRLLQAPATTTSSRKFA